MYLNNKTLYTPNKLYCYIKWLTLEKHAPMWTLGVGGKPLVMGFGNEFRVFRWLRRGGTGGMLSVRISESRGPSPKKNSIVW